MVTERKKLQRAKLIQRIRTVERTRSAAVASDAEATRMRLFAVAERTRSLAEHYSQRNGDMLAGELRSGQAMREQLQKLTHLSTEQATAAEQHSQAKLQEFAQSDQRMRKAEESKRELARRIVENLAKA
ncbi:hypothetical protein [Erythrobacter sp. SD-21]|uniref:hypothetical protein n=1 Tax=Erythrobacter sp. SD-21 TaxID=161528 RepID=UPI000153F82B|nr:hypothetical protein [Erythrobacter sp. SD-21]EDL49935.1 hypothetical protein ED21_25728 [Erythrobacter sp. SD-21]